MNAMPLAVGMMLVLTGCTSMSPVKSQSADLGRQIRSGHVVARGDDVEIVTTDGRRYQFRVIAIDKNTLSGTEIAVPIETIAQLKVRTISEVKTALLVDGITASVIWILVTVMSGLAFPA